MRRTLWAVCLLGIMAFSGAPARADGFLVPTDRSLPPLSLAYQRVNATIDGQVATTTVEQEFHNATPRDLEADYLFPLPPGASVREFAMWVNGKRLTGETLEAPRARHTYEDIVRRLKDPGLLEYVDRDLWKVRIFPVPANGDQRIEIKFTTLLRKDGDLIAYQYPLRTGSNPRQVTRDFTMVVKLTSPDALGPIYSPTHDVAIDRRGDRQATVSFERSRYTLDRDFSLFFAPKSKDVGLSLLTQRSGRDSRGYFLLLLSPRAEKDVRRVPRDLVVVLDTSYSMRGEKLRQAKGALRAALDSLGPDDRFALIQFATVVNDFRESLLKASRDNLADAREWVEKLEAQGATDIGSAVDEALKMRPKDRDDDGRTFQVVFFTDGLPTAGQNSKDILKTADDRASRGVRIFTFGVGDDVDTHLLDQLAESTRAASTYVRPSEDLEAKASALVSKISHPVRTDLRLRAGDDVRLVDIYPPHLPDLFQGEQLQVAGRYEGSGHVSLTLESRIGDRQLTETYEAPFPDREGEHDFIAPIWARRKVGYLLDQIRLHGEKDELRDEVIHLAREFGIATPYTSFLVAPDERPRHMQLGGGIQHGGGYGGAGGFQFRGAGVAPMQGAAPARLERLEESVRALGRVDAPAAAPVPGQGAQGQSGQAPALGLRQEFEYKAKSGRKRTAGQAGSEAEASAAVGKPVRDLQTADTYDAKGQLPAATPVSGSQAVEVAQHLAELKTQGRVDEAAPVVKTIDGHRFRKVDDVWVDERFERSAPTLKIKPFGAAYFRLLEQHKELKAVLALGQRVVWISPSGTAVIIDDQGDDEVPAKTLDALFAAKAAR